jgi:tetratricopeptide (TPR) repeat protein
MGVIYRAEDTKLKRTVALKFLPSELTSDPEAKGRFIHEAQAISALQHTNICTIHDIDEAPEGQLFIVMDCYDGETLKKKIERGPISFAEILDTADQVAQGLQKAHEKGIVHRDIKPANIFIANDGVVKILDFGLAKLTDRTLLTKAGSTLGTAAYMSPEQAKGIDVDARTDLFSLGVVMYEMATGKRPFAGDHEAALMYSIVNVDPPVPSSINHTIPKDLEAIILKLLEKSAAKRYQAARELRFELGSLIDLMDSPRKQSWRRRVPMLKRIYGVVGAVIVLAFIAWFVSPKLFPPPSKKPGWQIGILQFKLLAQRPQAVDWPMEIQMMMVDQLNGVEELKIISPFALNSVVGGNLQAIVSAKLAGESFVLNGTIESVDTTYVLRSTLTDVSDGSVKMMYSEPFVSERDLSRAVQNISEQILNYFQIQILSGDRRKKEAIQPWLNHRTKKLDAIKAFLQGTEFTFRMQPGSSNYFRKAIELDSTFITPRTWLISSLVNAGELAEAKLHQAFLLRHLYTARPFEQALIRWTGAMIARDTAAQVQALEQALEYSPHNYVLLYLLSDLKYSEGDYVAAARTIRPAVESGWVFQPASLLLGMSLFQMRNLTESREILEHSLSIEPVLAESYGFLAVLAFHDGDVKVSEDYVREFIVGAKRAGWPADSVYACIADNFATLGMYKPASEYYRKAIDINRGKPEYYLGVAKSTLELGDLSSAREAARRALVLNSASLQVQDIMGRVSDSLGDTSEALRRYWTFLSKDSTSVRSAEIRRRVGELMRN